MFLHNHGVYKQTSNSNIDGIAFYFAAKHSHVQKRDNWEAQHPKTNIFSYPWPPRIHKQANTTTKRQQLLPTDCMFSKPMARRLG